MTEPLHNIEGHKDAMRLVRKIEAYWCSRGATVNCHVEYVPGKHDRARTERIDGWWEVHSDMVDGLPARRGEEMSA